MLDLRKDGLNRHSVFSLVNSDLSQVCADPMVSQCWPVSSVAAIFAGKAKTCDFHV